MFLKVVQINLTAVHVQHSAMEPGLPQSRERRRCRSPVLGNSQALRVRGNDKEKNSTGAEGLSSGRRQQARRPAQQSRNAPKHDSSGTPACGVRTQQDDGVRSSGRQRVRTSRHTLTQLSLPECLDLHNWHESHHKVHRKQGTHLPSAKVLVKRNTSPAPAASPFRPNRNSGHMTAPQGRGSQTTVPDAVGCAHTSSRQPCGPRQWEKMWPVRKPLWNSKIGTKPAQVAGQNRRVCSCRTEPSETTSQEQFPQIHSKSRRHSLRRFESKQRRS